MKKAVLTLCALMPIVAASQCNVTYLGGEVTDHQTGSYPLAVDENGNSYGNFSYLGMNVWGPDGSTVAVSPPEPTDAAFQPSINNKKQAIVNSGSWCWPEFRDYSTDMMIWNWEQGTKVCLKPLPFQLPEGFSSTYLSRATVIDDKGWVYTSVPDRGTLRNRAVVWRNNGVAVELPVLQSGLQHFINGGNTSGLVVGQASTDVRDFRSVPIAWRSGIIERLPLPEGFTAGRAVSASSNGDIVGQGYVGRRPSSGLWWSEGKVKELPLGFTPSHINRQGHIIGRTGKNWWPAIYKNDKVLLIAKLMPAMWHKKGYQVTLLTDINDKSEVLAKYRGGPNDLDGSVLLRGCFGNQ